MQCFGMADTNLAKGHEFLDQPGNKQFLKNLIQRVS
jgi:hypothetical protein